MHFITRSSGQTSVIWRRSFLCCEKWSAEHWPDDPSHSLDFIQHIHSHVVIFCISFKQPVLHLNWHVCLSCFVSCYLVSTFTFEKADDERAHFWEVVVLLLVATLAQRGTSKFCLLTVLNETKEKFGILKNVLSCWELDNTSVCKLPYTARH